MWNRNKIIKKKKEKQMVDKAVSGRQMYKIT